MFAVNQDKVEGSTGHVLHNLGGILLAALALLWRRVGLHSVVCRLQDERRRSDLIDHLNWLDDHSLRDIGIKREDIDAVVETLVRRGRESRKSGSRQLARSRSAYISAGRAQPS